MQAILKLAECDQNTPSPTSQEIIWVLMQSDAGVPNSTMILSSNKEHWPSDGLSNFPIGDPKQGKGIRKGWLRW